MRGQYPRNMHKNLIGGEWVDAASGNTFAVTNPANDQVIALVPDSGPDDMRAAIAAATAAFPGWRATTADDRAAILRRFHGLIMEHQESLAALITAEHGKPIAEARGEVAYGAGFILWAAEEARRIYGDIIAASSPDKRILVNRQPIGVTGAITPWNFPLAMLTRKTGPALAAGCVQIVKPAEQTPLTTLRLGELATEAGLPPGVLNIVTADTASTPGVGAALFADPAVRKVSFTGSTEVGRILMHQAADNIVRLSLELGGHAPFVVFDDADLEVAVAGALTAKFRNAGQTCVAANRFYVQRNVHDEFVSMLTAKVADMRVGIGTAAGVVVGPLIDDAAVDKVQTHVSDAIAHGASLVHGGSLVDAGPGTAPRFFAPTVLTGVTPKMLVSNEETFGPVVAISVFDTEPEVVSLANDTPYGLAAYVFTRDAARAFRVSEALDYGIVGINDGLPSTPQAPFGGMKWSGLGREGGKYVMDDYLETKYISWKI